MKVFWADLKSYTYVEYEKVFANEIGPILYWNIQGEEILLVGEFPMDANLLWSLAKFEAIVPKEVALNCKGIAFYGSLAEWDWFELGHTTSEAVFPRVKEALGLS